MMLFWLTSDARSTIFCIMVNDSRSKPLREVAHVSLGHPFRGAIPEVSSGGVHVVQVRDVNPSGLTDCDALLRTEVDGRKEPNWLRDQDILYVTRGTVPYAGLVTKPPPRTVCSSHIYVVRVIRTDVLLPAFVAWQLNQAPVRRFLRQSAEGSNQLSIRRTVLDRIAIRIPPLDQQQTVVDMQRAASAERETMEALIRSRELELESVAERLLTQ
jgi:restriction endonuclease S subunit